MSGDDCKAMERPAVPDAPRFRVTESWRMVLRCKRLAATSGGKGTRIKVAEFDRDLGATWRNAKPLTVTVPWDHSLNGSENYVQAVTVYLERAGWDGEWAVSTCDGGAVAVYVPGTSGGAL